jgi:ATP:ADP antiporter, AAA family
MVSQQKDGFSVIRGLLWPIHRFELKKFIPMMLLFFFISFNYHFLRIVKDTLIITAPDSTAEVIPFLKVWCILPAAFFLTFFFTSLGRRYKRETVFYVIMMSFLAFFTVFMLVLYPYASFFQLDSLSITLTEILPVGCRGLIAIIRYWMYTLFYVAAESWSNIMVSMLLWGFVNDVVTVKESRRFYALFGIGINSAGIVAGWVGGYLSTIMKGSFSTVNPIIAFLGGKTLWDQTLMLLFAIVIVCGFISIRLYRWLHINIFVDRHNEELEEKDDPESSEPAKKKPRLSLRKSLLYVTQSRYMLCVAIIVLAYNCAINFTEVIWKSQIKQQYPNSGDYFAYMSNVTFYIGALATMASFCISGNIIRIFGWKPAALVTPFLMFATSIPFVYFLFEQYSGIAPLSAILGTSSLALTVFAGSLQNCLCRSSKYTVFDDTKEMAFIPLSSENRLKGKAAIDGIGSRLGKSGSSLTLQGMMMLFGSLSAAVPYIFGFIFAVIPLWIISVFSLGKEFSLITDSSEEKQKV